jgi:2-dehydro-3-deoxyglucarate aldolase
MQQQNGFRAAIENGDVVFGARSSTFSPAVIEIYGELGIDFVWLDFEHIGPSPWDSTVFEELTRAAEVGGTELFVRLPSGDPSLVRKVLDAGVRNIFVPRVDTAEEGRSAVKATRFEYDGDAGERGMASGRSRTWGLGGEDYIATEDEEVCLGAMIEKTSAVENLDEILIVPDLGFGFIGPSDLSVQLGHPGDKTHPDVTETITEIREAAHDAGIPTGVIASDPDAIETAVEDGHQIIRIGGDLSSVTSVIGERLEAVEQLR